MFFNSIFLFLYLIIWRFDIAVAAVFFTNIASQKYIFDKRSDCGCYASRNSKYLIICFNKMFIVYIFYF